MVRSPLYSSLLFHYSSVVHMKYYLQLLRLQPYINAEAMSANDYTRIAALRIVLF